MEAVEQFRREREAAVASYASDTAFKTLSRQWLADSMARRYVYNFDWLGRPIIQYPQEIVAVQEVIWATRPDLVIETGIAHGGSLILSASLLALLDYCDAALKGQVLDPTAPRRRVLGIDIDIRAHNRRAIEAHPLARSIDMIEGSSTDPAIVDEVRRRVGPAQRIMVCLDSSHTHDHVLAELRAYGPMVSPGCYCIVFDTFIEDMRPGFIADRPWDVGNNPRTALRKWLEEAPDFEIDKDLATKLMVTACPDGFLKRSEGRPDPDGRNADAPGEP